MNVVDCWSWNGYNSQWVQEFDSRRAVIAEALKMRRKAMRRNEDFDCEIIADNDAEFTVRVETGYDFYGWRESVDYLTTLKGVYEKDEEDNLMGTWFPPMIAEFA